MKYRLPIGLLLLIFNLPVFAAITITSATVNGGNSTTVTAGATVTVEVFVTTSGFGNNNDWESTRWQFGSSGATTCEDHADFTSL
jgi:hypothetical protein